MPSNPIFSQTRSNKVVFSNSTNKNESNPIKIDKTSHFIFLRSEKIGFFLTGARSKSIFSKLFKELYKKNENFFNVFKRFDIIRKVLSKLKERTSLRKPERLKKFHYDLIEDYVCWFEEKPKISGNFSVKINLFIFFNYSRFSKVLSLCFATLKRNLSF